VRFLFSIVLICLSLTSCDLFSTRTPDPPDVGSTFFWTAAGTPNTLLENFKGALQVADAANYAKCFISTHDTATTPAVYAFTPRPGLDATSKLVFDGWNTQSEQNFLTKLRSSLVSNPRLEVSITNLQINQSNATVATLQANYIVSFPLPSNSTLPESISGSLIFDMRFVTIEGGTQEWRIINWTDDVQASNPQKTFTDLKVQLAS
jgi:hypothetical protein